MRPSALLLCHSLDRLARDVLPPVVGSSESKRPIKPESIARCGTWSVAVQRERYAIALVLQPLAPVPPDSVKTAFSFFRFSGTVQGPSVRCTSTAPSSVISGATVNELPPTARLKLPSPSVNCANEASS